MGPHIGNSCVKEPGRRGGGSCRLFISEMVNFVMNLRGGA